MAEIQAQAVPEVPARLVFMGGQAAEGRARVVERSKAWRRSQIMKDLALLLLIPIVIFIPPHFPWPIVVTAIAVLRAFNHAREYRTLLSLHGPCPKCGTEQDFTELGRMGNSHKVTCASCRWDLFVDVARAGAAT
ncbi:MAG TPA: hypothetical protein VJT67_17165 [Longimicrobiaceae bacterium]|nr:hypothetical protein [Longimicrobiaceae bacterium]